MSKTNERDLIIEEREARDRIGKIVDIQWYEVPKSFYPGKLFVSANYLVEQGVTRYSLPHLMRLIRSRVIPAYKLGRNLVLDPQGVEVLLKREEESRAGRIRRAGMKAGQRVVRNQ